MRPLGGKASSPGPALLLALLLPIGCGQPPAPEPPSLATSPAPMAPQADPAADAFDALRASQAEVSRAFGGRGTLFDILLRFPELPELAAWATTLGEPAFEALWSRHLDAIHAWLAAMAARPAGFVLDPAALEADVILFDQAVLQSPHFVLAGSHYPETDDFRSILAAGVFDPTGVVARLADIGVKVSLAAPRLAARAQRYLDGLATLPASMAWAHPLLGFCFRLSRGIDPDSASIAALAGDPARAGRLENFARLRVLGVPVLVPPMITRIDCGLRRQVLDLLARSLEPGLKGMPASVRAALWEESLLAACKAGRHCQWDAGTGDLDPFDGLLDRIEAEDQATRDRMKLVAQACHAVVTWKVGAPASSALVGRVERLASAARLPLSTGP